jgi:hypothetical protein
MVEGKYFDHPDLIIQKHPRMKMMLLDPNNDLPIATIEAIFKRLLSCINRV